MLSAHASKWWLGGLIALVSVSLGLNAQDQHRDGHPKPERCQLSPVFTRDPEFPAIKDWKPVRLEAPTAQLIIRQDGSVKSAHLVRSSNVGNWDQVFLNAVKKWEFSKAPDCGLRKTIVSVDIHVR
jgi:hypothetical protein